MSRLSHEKVNTHFIRISGGLIAVQFVAMSSFALIFYITHDELPIALAHEHLRQ